MVSDDDATILETPRYDGTRPANDEGSAKASTDEHQHPFSNAANNTLSSSDCCSICLAPVQKPSPKGCRQIDSASSSDAADSMVNDGTAVTTLACGHRFHLACIVRAFNAKGRMECPNCRTIEDKTWPMDSRSDVEDAGREARAQSNDIFNVHMRLISPGLWVRVRGSRRSASGGDPRSTDGSDATEAGSTAIGRGGPGDGGVSSIAAREYPRRLWQSGLFTELLTHALRFHRYRCVVRRGTRGNGVNPRETGKGVVWAAKSLLRLVLDMVRYGATMVSMNDMLSLILAVGYFMGDSFRNIHFVESCYYNLFLGLLRAPVRKLWFPVVEAVVHRDHPDTGG